MPRSSTNRNAAGYETVELFLSPEDQLEFADRARTRALGRGLTVEQWEAAREGNYSSPSVADVCVLLWGLDDEEPAPAVGAKIWGE